MGLQKELVEVPVVQEEASLPGDPGWYTFNLSVSESVLALLCLPFALVMLVPVAAVLAFYLIIFLLCALMRVVVHRSPSSKGSLTRTGSGELKNGDKRRKEGKQRQGSELDLAGTERIPLNEEQRFRALATELAAARHAGDVPGLVDVLEEVMTPTLAGALDERVQENAASAKGALVLVEEICQALRVLKNHINAGGPMSEVAKAAAIVCRESFGKSCLFLSGGGMLGMYHLGMIRKLLENDALPDHLCGTSVGSIVGAYIATRTDAELRANLARADDWYYQMGPEEGPFPHFWGTVVLRVLRQGFIYDYQHHYDHQATFVSNGLTFAEAYARTGRTFTITCAPAGGGALVLLNRHTAPRVLIASAVCASSAMPMLVEAVGLLERLPDGTVQRWRGGGLMRDGTMAADTPKDELKEMLNVRFSLVSQVNPHVILNSIPLYTAQCLRKEAAAAGQRSLLQKAAMALVQAEQATRKTFWTLLRSVQAITSLPPRNGWLTRLFFQDYSGDVNIFHHEMTAMDYVNLIYNEQTREGFDDKLKRSEALTEEFLPRAVLRARVEDALQECLPVVVPPASRRGTHSAHQRQPAGGRIRRVEGRAPALSRTRVPRNRA